MSQHIHQQLFENIEHVVVLDHLLSGSAQMADLLLPSASSAEQQGCWLNSQGLLQLSQANLAPNKQRQASWQWCQQVSSNNSEIPAAQHYQQLLKDCAVEHPLLASIVDFVQTPSAFKIARQSIRASGRTAINAKIDVATRPPKSTPSTSTPSTA